MSTVPASVAPPTPRPPLTPGRRAAAWALGLLLASVAIVLWSRTRPGFDPFGWLAWGNQTIHWNLDTNAAPSWKPLPYLFTVPLALLGHAQARLWMVVSVFVSLSGGLFGARVAARLTLNAHPEAFTAAKVAAVLGGVGVLSIHNYAHYVLSAQSDPMIVALCLAAIDAHLHGRERLALLAGTLAALGRPETWPFLGLYGLWLLRHRPRERPWVVGCGLITLALWFGIPAFTSRSPFVAASNALGSGRRLHSNLILGTAGRFLGLVEPGVYLAALLGTVLAWRARDRTTVALAAGVVTWVIIETGFALHGWPGLDRYMFEAAGVAAALSGAAAGRLLAAPAEGPRLRAGQVVVSLLALSLLVTGVLRARVESRDLAIQRERTVLFGHLAADVARLGGAAALRRCGEPLITLQDQTYLAWTLGINVAKIGFKFPQAFSHGNPLIRFTPGHHGGWHINLIHQQSAPCRRIQLRAHHLHLT